MVRGEFLMARRLWEKLHIADCCKLLERGLVVFTFYVTLLTLFRLFFIGYLGFIEGYLENGIGYRECAEAMWVGFKLSIQTAGILTAVTMVPTIPFMFLGKLPYNERKIPIDFGNGKYSRPIYGTMKWKFPTWKMVARLTVGIVVTVMTVMFCASIPYYRQFHSKFNQLMFNTMNDDVYALAVSMLQEFDMHYRLLGALLLSLALISIFWKYFYRKQLIPISIKINGKKVTRKKATGDRQRFYAYMDWIRLLGLVTIYHLLSVLVVFGGSMGWETATDWENAGVTRSEFLNEAILDDFQATYRAYTMNNRFLACNGLSFTTDHIRELAAHMANRPADTDDLDVYLTRQAQGEQIPRPKYIFVIVAESYANWPLLDKYADLHVADGVKGIIAADDSDYCPTFLPNGSSTVSAVTGIVTGLADANLYLTTMQQSFEAPYPTAAAPVMEKLGYVTNFWYAGPATWERIGAFTLGQGFDTFHGMGDITSEATGSVWGYDDEYLYETVLKQVPVDTDSFNVILNVSNHSPYNLDLESKGYPVEKVRAGLPADMQNDDELLRQLGHYWYADKEMAKFVKALKEKYKGCLVVIIGDHADRYNLEKNPSMYQQYGVPFIITGNGVHKGIMGTESAGSQIDIVPTIVEMIAPQGFEYESIGRSLTRGNNVGVNYGFWITRHSIGEADTYPLVPISIDGGEVTVDQVEMSIYIDTVRSLSWWRPKYGPILDDKFLE